MKIRAAALLCCLAMVAMFAYAQGDEGYQSATVVSFEKVPANEQHPENADQYKIAMRMAGTLYLCQASGPIADFMGWAPNKEFPAKLINNDKAMLVKSPNGQIVQLNIKGTKHPK